MMSKYGWSPILSSVRFLPVGFSGTFVAIVAPMLLKYWTPKLAISVGLTLQFIGTMLLPFADTKDKFWSHCLPAFIMYVFPSFYLDFLCSLAVSFCKLLKGGFNEIS